jgi:hypothetical protein
MAASGNTKASGKKLAANPSHQIWKDSDCRCERRMDASKGGQAVSDTPRTDAKRGFHDLDTAVDAEFSEQLECELNAANERIKRLEEAGDKIVESGWSVQDWSGMCVVWAKAKEDKL